ncbi:hypothetical protein ENUP19_0158G0032 [Entamoeba nuttalli]|uniref:Reverse transcriptase domain-containing protein n=1 Tax=Entamoeba nuttalli TaxID=412467 RepID=A0ABQ0DLH5_9EUKA
MEEEIIKHQWKDNELKEIISKMNKKEDIEEEEIMKIFKEEEMKEQEDVQFINYYYNKKKIHQIINIINKNEIIINTLDDYYHYIKSVASTINIINKNKQERSGKKSIERILQSKICRLRDLLHNKQYMKLKRILHIKKYDIYHIKIKTNEQIKYYKYLRKMKRIEIEARKNNWKRIRWNYKMMKYGKRQHLNKPKEDEYPDNISTINFWKGIYETNTNIDFLNINLYEILIENRINDRMAIITPNELDCAIKFTANWKAPGVDKIQGCWIKYLEQPKKYLLRLFNEWLNNPNEIPPHFIQGRTILIYKKGDKLDPQNYRPITCLNCLLKIYTSILKMKIENQLMLNPIEKQLSLNQIGCKKYTYASKEGLLYNTIIIQLLLKAKWKWVETYYDVSKAYDSINHQWIKQCLIYFNIPLSVINSILYILNNTYLNLYYNKESVGMINVERGIIQGDSLSPLLFVLSIDVLSKQLDKQISKLNIKMNGEEKQVQLNHILYMDDLKIMTNILDEMEKAHKLTKEIFNAIGLKINVEKSGIMTNINSQINGELAELPRVTNDNPYKYLGIEIGDKVNINKYCTRILNDVSSILSSLNTMKYSSLNTIRKINSDIISKLRYGFCIVTWKLGEFENIDKQIRKSLIQLKLYSRNIPKSRLYVKINELGLGLMSVRDECEIGEMIEAIKENPNGINKRMKKAFGKKINFNEIMNIIEINERKHDVKNVFEWVNNELNEI